MIPVDIFHSKRTPEALAALLQSALDIHANMLRLWGGATQAWPPCGAMRCMLPRSSLW